MLLLKLLINALRTDRIGIFPAQLQLFSQGHGHLSEVTHRETFHVENEDSSSDEHLLLFVEHDIPDHETDSLNDFQTKG